MKFVINDIIKVDEDDYYVADMIKYNNKSYAYLIKTDENEELTEEFDIVLVNDDYTLSEVDNELFSELNEMFIEKVSSENL